MQDYIVWNRTDDLHKMDLALNDLQRLICHKIQPTKSTVDITNTTVLLVTKMYF